MSWRWRALLNWCRERHLELLTDVVSFDGEAESAYRLFDVRARLEDANDILYLDGRVAFESEIIKKLLAKPRNACAVEPDTWDSNSPRAMVEDGRVAGISTSLTRKSSTGRALSFFKFDAATLQAVFASVSQQLAYSGDVRTTIEQVVDRLLKSGKIDVEAVMIEAGTWFLVDQVAVASEDKGDTLSDL